VLVIAVGVLTFFLPLVTIDPPVADTAHWSGFNIVQKMYEGRLTQPICERCGEPLVRSLFALPLDFSLGYLMLGCALVATCLSESPGVLRALAFMGAAIFGWGQNGHTAAREFS